MDDLFSGEGDLDIAIAKIESLNDHSTLDLFYWKFVVSGIRFLDEGNPFLWDPIHFRFGHSFQFNSYIRLFNSTFHEVAILLNIEYGQFFDLSIYCPESKILFAHDVK